MKLELGKKICNRLLPSPSGRAYYLMTALIKALRNQRKTRKAKEEKTMNTHTIELSLEKMEMVTGGAEDRIDVKVDTPDEFERLEPKAFGVRV